jgi:hypothetical protein
MSDSTRTAVVEAAKVLTTMPAQFCALIIINTVFILGLLFFLQSHDKDRIEAMRIVLTSCTEGLAHSQPVKP